VPLLAPQGIFKPAILNLPLSITTTPPSPRKPRPYNDEFDNNGLLRYRYRGTDPNHRDNVGLREAIRSATSAGGEVYEEERAAWRAAMTPVDKARLARERADRAMAKARKLEAAAAAS
jgi:putative restriction endonuclease